MLFNPLLNNISISLEEPLNYICTQVSIKVTVFVENALNPIQNYVQLSMPNCYFFLNLLETF